MTIAQVRYDTLMVALRWYLDENDFNFHINDCRNDWLSTEVKLGINWCALGTVSPDETIRFANGLKRFAELVEKINALELTYDYDLNDYEIVDSATRMTALDRIVKNLEKGNDDAVVKWLRKAR